MARLVIFDETVRGVDLSSHPVILGRSRRADIPIRDEILSRKHCSIVPVGSGYRLFDLKSSNGTFVNGSRIEKQELKSDDIIEIGNTVMVILDTDTWKRGSGLPRLRNPAKARELIRAIRKREVLEHSEKKAEVPERAPRARGGAALRQKKALTDKEAAFLGWARDAWLATPVARDLLESYLAHQVVSIMVRHDPDLAERLSVALEKLLAAEVFEKGEGSFRAELRRVVEAWVLGPSGKAPEGEGRDRS